MKKLMTLAAMLAMVLVAATPAVAQVTQEGEQEGDSGEVGQSFTVTGDGSNGSSCSGLSGGSQTGNSQGQTDLDQYASDAHQFEFDESGANVNFSSNSSTECKQAVNQAAATGAPKAAPPPPPAAPAPKAEAKAAEAKAAPAPAPAPKAEAKAAEAKAGEKKELPKTGGEGSSLFALGVGVLLVGGGLLARKLFR